MSDVNWWLMALSFGLGLILTFAFLIRRVSREVPVYAPLGRGPSAEAAAKTAAAEKTVEIKKSAGKAGAAKVAGDKADSADESPYGTGSIRLKSGSKSAPDGYLIKGNEDSMLYHTVASESYEETIAEVWFVDEASAEAAGFKKYK